MSGRFESRTVLITGGARGQGAEQARRFAAEGASVVIADVLDDEGAVTAKGIGEGARYLHLDVTDEAAWEGVVADCGDLHVLVNNAGILGEFTPIAKLSAATFRRVLDVNLVGCFLGIKHGGAAIGRSGGGAIVNISSISGMWGTPNQAGYTASKFGVRGLTKTAALELGRIGVRVNSVHPGGIATDMTGGASAEELMSGWTKRLPVARIGLPSDVAGAVLFLASDDAAYITGTELVVDGGAISGDVSLLPPAK